jgi:3-oxoacyl-[acyl-carrier protein] reductase
MDLGLKNKVALVIASSQGLGKAVAKELVKEGAHVMLTSRSEDKLAEVKEELEALHGGKVAYFPCDITKNEDIQKLVARTHEVFGKIDILLNNAGGPPSGKFDSFSDEAWQQAFELNLLSYIRIIREVLPDLHKDGGRIVNIASISVKTPLPNLVLSNTFRNGIVGLSKTLADELASDNILVNVVAPGKIETDRLKYLNEANAKAKELPLAEVDKAAIAGIPLGRYGTPEEFAKAVVFLLSEANTYITGSTIYVDGGAVKAI